MRKVLACMGCALMLAGGVAQAQQPAPADGDGRGGTFKTVTGQVTLTRGAERLQAQVGGPIRAGDRIQTGPTSSASATLKDGSVLAFGPNCEVELTQFTFNSTTYEGDVLMSVLRGTLRMLTGQIAKLKPEQVKVTTPTAVVGVRGTDFIVEATP